ncbi:ATP-binding protein [Kitasatospora viridis]|uniref:Anti-sigma regulatory factor (Ser/Thr protein kinase) n=1 Tax=Kitasatospora viridis TaxID=281105 RepID=A0A561UBT9_9ACTN|nr:ATP-binding protein [Kitasatospora viridis]TWF96828.1 anti-sigma regulatory factor (Ser/Thr protein kinase) [Kitasatospora viridis]
MPRRTHTPQPTLGRSQWLPCHGSSARLARSMLRALLNDLTDVELYGVSAELVVSELIANAVVHGSRSPQTPIFVRLEASVDRLRVEVHDSTRHLPIMQPAHPDDECGRGLRLVDQLAADWGHSLARDGSGKQVWAIVMPEGPEPLRTSP